MKHVQMPMVMWWEGLRAEREELQEKGVFLKCLWFLYLFICLFHKSAYPSFKSITELLTYIQMSEVICLKPQSNSHDTNHYRIVSFHPWENCCLALQTTYMLGLAFIRTSGTFLAHARQYWQRSTAHSTSRGANITNHLLLSMAALQLLPAWPPTTPTSCLISPSLHCPRNDQLHLSNIKLTTWPLHVLFLWRTSVLYWFCALISDLMSVEICGPHACRCVSV